jgi:hypothetical protein
VFVYTICVILICFIFDAQMTVIRPADMDALQEALDKNNVSVVLAILFTTIFGANLFIHK